MTKNKPIAVGLDDSKAILTVLSGICRQQGIDFEGTQEWSQIVKIITRLRISSSVVLISDYHMSHHGGVDGDCVVKALRKIFSDLPVIVFTASPEKAKGLVSEMKLQYPETPISLVIKPGQEQLARLLASFRDAVLKDQKVVF